MWKRIVLSYLFGLSLVLNVTYFSRNNFLMFQSDYHSNLIETLNFSLSALQAENIAIEEQIKTIVENIYKIDLFENNIGGFAEKEEYSLDNILKMVLNRKEENRIFMNAELFFIHREESLRYIPNIWPFKQSPHNRITSPFGTRYSPFTGQLTKHAGIDLSGPTRTEILATADGVIREHWLEHPIYGRHIIIDHGNGYETMYAHLSETYIRERQRVEKGQVIGRMGNTGLTRGDHLHYEIRKNGEPIDPINFLKTYLTTN